MNVVILVGRLTKDFSLKNGVAKSSVAVKRDFGNGTDFIDLVAFKNNADYCAKYLKKGELVAIEGSWQISKYNDKNYSTCVINRINGLGGGEVARNDQPLDDVALDIPQEEELTTGDDDLPF